VSRRFVFIGVTTGASSMVRIFPRWREALGLEDVELEGWDLPVGAPPARYRETVTRLREEPDVAGALVTSHKLGLFQAAADLFDELDEDARRLGEVSCIARRDGRLLGWAKDAISAARALEAVVPPGYFAGGGHALVLGAGGAGGAIVERLLTAQPPPGRVIVTDRSPERLERFRDVETRCTGDATGLLATLPPRSLVVNATGMGKDLPGSPLSAGARFPQRSAVWELNYRGEREFLRQARAQQDELGLRVEDGWRYFVVGWAAVIEKVFARRLEAADVDLLERIATANREPRTPAR
jgi:shikimate dehydrogenase